jgi:ABC-type bacteriocin/lantibiotic exporter with double-glycine peptidase domain
VTLRCPWFLDTSVSDVRLTINSGERVYLTGKSGSGKGSLMKAVAKYLRPVKNTDRTMGVLKVGGLDIQQIGRKWLT